MPEIEVKLIIDESKIHIYTFAQRMRDVSVDVLSSLALPEGSVQGGRGAEEIAHAIQWLKNMEL
jgi:hypothetical protein